MKLKPFWEERGKHILKHQQPRPPMVGAVFLHLACLNLYPDCSISMPNKKVGHEAGCHLLHFRTERAFHAQPVTIAISIKINDGLVLASDSASTVLGQVPNTGELQVLNVYNNAIKVFNLRKGLPIGAITWGSGSIGQDSISTIIKDLRERFTGDDPDHQDWKLDPKTYTTTFCCCSISGLSRDGGAPGARDGDGDWMRFDVDPCVLEPQTVVCGYEGLGPCLKLTPSVELRKSRKPSQPQSSR